VQDLTSNVARGLQEQDTVYDVADLARAAERRKPADGAAKAAGRVQRGLDHAPADGVDPDAARGVLKGQRPGRRGQGAVRHGGVVGGGVAGERPGGSGARGANQGVETVAVILVEPLMT
jgi:IS5 family transposase